MVLVLPPLFSSLAGDTFKAELSLSLAIFLMVMVFVLHSIEITMSRAISTEADFYRLSDIAASRKEDYRSNLRLITNVLPVSVVPEFITRDSGHIHVQQFDRCTD
jgi:hypothetical protein